MAIAMAVYGSKIISSEPFKDLIIPIIHSADTHAVRIKDGNVPRFKTALTGLNITTSSITKIGTSMIISVLFNMISLSQF